MENLPSDREQINMLRERIEALDEELIKLLAERIHISKRIGILKKAHGLPVVYEERETILKELHAKLAVANVISSTFIDSLFDLIITHSRELQESETMLGFPTDSIVTIHSKCAESVDTTLSEDKVV